ncbi:MAG: hypothetical protein OXI18_02100 [bacterium]|nr:hypothetical protein [bacterium]
MRYVESELVEESTENVSVFFSGSRVEGIFNDLSDLDIYLIGDLTDPSATGAANIAMKEGYYVDSEFYDIPTVTAVIDTVLMAQGNSTSLVGLKLSDINLAYRLAIGNPVYVSEAYRKSCADKLDSNVISTIFAQFCTLNAQMNIEQARRVESMELQLPTFVYAQETGRWAIDAILAAGGEGFPSRKWRHEKAERLQVPTGEMQDWWIMDTSLAASTISDVSHVVEHASSLSALGTTDVDALLAATARPVVLSTTEAVGVMRSNDGRIWRIPSSMLDRVLALDSESLCEVSTRGVTSSPFHLRSSLGFAYPRFYGLPTAEILSGRSGIDSLLMEGRELEMSGNIAAAEFDIVGALRANQPGVAYIVTSHLLDLCIEWFLVGATGLLYNFRDRAELYWCASEMDKDGLIDSSLWSIIEELLIDEVKKTAVREFCLKVFNLAEQLGLASAAAMTDESGNLYRRRAREHFQICSSMGCRTSLHDFFDA